MDPCIILFICFFLFFRYAELTEVVPATTENLTLIIKKQTMSITKGYFNNQIIRILLTSYMYFLGRYCNEAHLILHKQTVTNAQLADISSTPRKDFTSRSYDGIMVPSSFSLHHVYDGVLTAVNTKLYLFRLLEVSIGSMAQASTATIAPCVDLPSRRWGALNKRKTMLEAARNSFAFLFVKHPKNALR